MIQIKKNYVQHLKFCQIILTQFNFPQIIRYIYLKNPNKPIYSGRDLSITSYVPENFKETISRKNPLFEGVVANDGKDLVNFLSTTSHEELNIANQADNNNGNTFTDQTNQPPTFNKPTQNSHRIIVQSQATHSTL